MYTMYTIPSSQPTTIYTEHQNEPKTIQGRSNGSMFHPSSPTKKTQYMPTKFLPSFLPSFPLSLSLPSLSPPLAAKQHSTNILHPSPAPSRSSWRRSKSPPTSQPASQPLKSVKEGVHSKPFRQSVGEARMEGWERQRVGGGGQ